MVNPFISVITPTYNRSHLLPRVWESLQKQTFKDFEWIVIDDGSTDNTQEVIRSFKDPRIVYVRLPENRGVNAARNRGIAESKSPYLVFLDSDDELVPEALELIAQEWKHLNDEEVGVIGFRCKVPETGCIIGHMEGERLKLQYKDIICENLVKGEFLMTARREVFLNLRFPEEIKGLEALLWWNIAKKWKYLFINQPLRIYHRTPGQLTGVESAIRRADSLAEGYDRLIKEHREACLAYCPAQYGYYLVVAALYHALVGHRKKAISNILKGLRYSPKKTETLGLLATALLGKRTTQFFFRLRAYWRGKNG